MIGVIIVYSVAFFAYWGIQTLKAIPTFLRWALLLLSAPVLILAGMVTSLPIYLKKDGKMYKYRYLVIFTLIMIALFIYLSFLPA